MVQTVKQYATMAHSSSTISSLPRHRMEPEGAPSGPQPMIPEETMDMPISPLANRISIALAKKRINIDHMCINITHTIHNMYIALHSSQVQQTVSNSTHWFKVQ